MTEMQNIALQTGVLTVETYPGAAFPFERLCAFAARNNRKRGFLFLSKVLGKHWPSAPRTMQSLHRHLAGLIPADTGPTVFIGMAETATGLGQGVFEAFLARHPGHPALFLHSTRYRVPGRAFLGFEEQHTHAPNLYLYRPLQPEHQALFQQARNLVLIDDEISTGATLCNLARAYQSFNPQIERVYFACITDFTGEGGAERFSAQTGLPVRCLSALRGAFSFAPAEAWPLEPAPPAVGDNTCMPEMLAEGLGRFGIAQPFTIPTQDLDTLLAGLKPGSRVLALGTGELMHPAFCLGLALEARGFAVRVQATTRSPILLGAGICKRLVFADNYGEGVGNYLYNVAAEDYDLVIICHETPRNEALEALAGLLGHCVFYPC
jgi:hypothetical protein